MPPRIKSTLRLGNSSCPLCYCFSDGPPICLRLTLWTFHGFVAFFREIPVMLTRVAKWVILPVSRLWITLVSFGTFFFRIRSMFALLWISADFSFFLSFRIDYRSDFILASLYIAPQTSSKGIFYIFGPWYDCHEVRSCDFCLWEPQWTILGR